MQTYDSKDLGPCPIIVNLCRQLSVRETVNEAVYWDEKQCLLDPGTHNEGFIVEEDFNIASEGVVLMRLTFLKEPVADSG